MLPTARGWLVLLSAVVCLLWGLGNAIHPFLAVEETFPEDGGGVDLLCVEGWAADSLIEATVAAYRTGRYGRVAVTGGPTQSREKFIGFDSYAAMGAHRLESLGIPRDRIVVSIPGAAERRRTLQDVVELQRTLRDSGIEPRRIQIFSTDVHTRRTRMLYRRVFGEGVEIRALAIRPEGYDPDRWWATSDGLKSVIMEAISYVFEAFSPIGKDVAPPAAD